MTAGCSRTLKHLLEGLEALAPGGEGGVQLAGALQVPSQIKRRRVCGCGHLDRRATIVAGVRMNRTASELLSDFQSTFLLFAEGGKA